MELKTCEYCGTSYDAALRQCPLCGKAAEPSAAEPIVLQSDGAPAPRRREKGKGGKRLAKNHTKPAAQTGGEEEPYAIPKGMMKAICIILAAAVTAGAAFAIYNLKWFAPKDKDTDQQETLQTETQPPEQPAQPQPSEEQYMNEEDYTPTAEQTQPEQPAVTVSCTALSLSTNTVTFEEAEQFYGITYTREPADCNEEVVFSSDNESIATVNQQGKIVAVNAGSAVITARCGTQTASCLVTCDFKIIEEPETTGDEELSLNNTDMTFFSPGEQFTLTVNGAPEGADTTYSSADPSVAAVSDRGVITAMGSGTTTITVYVGGRDPLSCIVRCNLDSSTEAADGSYSISHSDVTMSLMGEYFKLRLLDSNGDAVSGVSWSSGDTSVCTVDDSGVVTAAGKGTTTVSTTYGGATYQCIVRCNLN